MSRTVDQTIEQFQAAQETTGQSESDALCQQLQAYNQSLTANGQTLTDAWDYEQAPITVEYMPAMGSSDTSKSRIWRSDCRCYWGHRRKIWPREPPCCPRPVCHRGESTNCVIAGHRGYRGSPYFRNIQRLQVGSASMSPIPGRRTRDLVYRI